MNLLNPYILNQSTYLFDIYANGLYGYSYQKLKSDVVYSRLLQRSSDMATTELIAPATGSPTGATLTSSGLSLSDWAGINGVAEITVYDQSGNGNHISNTFANAPKLYVSGTLQTKDGYMCASFALTDNLQRAVLPQLADGNNFSLFTKSYNNSTSAFGVLLNTSTNNSSRFLHCHDTRTNKRGSYAQASTFGFADLDQRYANTNIWQQTAIVKSTKQVSHWKDGVAGVQNASWTGTYQNDTLIIGFSINGGILEHIAFSEDKSATRVAIETNQNNRYP